ncbi:hypothetical protein Tco_1079603, partial [Tanacetum coccineum]
HKLTKEKLINGGKPNSKKQVDDNKCPWVVLVSKIKSSGTWQLEADHQVPTRVFKRIYVCLGPLKAKFKARMREFLGIVGAFMKGPYPRQPLTAVSVDPNNGIYPLAYGLVETENIES